MPADDTPRADRGFTIFIATLALVISMGALLAVAFRLNDTNTQQTQQAATAAALVPVEELKMVVKSDEEHGRMGADGNWHDAFLPADVSVKAGSTVKVTVYNYDEGEHSFTAPGLGVNATIAAGSEGSPTATTFTFTAPAKAGPYAWFCALPCDPWAMSHSGYMRGSVTVT